MIRREEVEARKQIVSSRNELAVDAYVALARMQIERIHNAMDSCTQADLPALQGELRAYKKVVAWANDAINDHTVDK